MFTDPSQAEGLRARFDLSPGVPLTEGMVVSSIEELSEVGSDASLLIPRGLVAISIPVNRFSTVAYGLQRGDHVNLISTMLVVDLDQQFQTSLPNVTGGFIAPGPQVVTFSQSETGTTGSVAEGGFNNLAAQSTTGGDFSLQGRAEVDPILNQPLYLVPSEVDQRPRLVSQTLLQDIVVLNVGEFPRVDAQGNIIDETQQQQQQDGQAPAEGEQAQAALPPRPDIITLIVTPQDAVTLNYLLYAGAELNMVLRPSGDDTRVFTEAVTLQFLLDQYNIPVPPKVAFGLEPRVDSLNLPGSEQEQEQGQ
jgi:pilus assembly protein CpaB